MYVQVMPLEDANTYRFDPFDLTKTWSHKDYPLIEVGRMVLNRNPENYFAEVEQATFSPGTLVPGIDVSPDKMLQGRLFAYHDAHRYRVGANHQMLPINAAKNQVNNYQRDGQMNFGNNGGGSVYYEPNSYGGPTETAAAKPAPLEVTGVTDSVPYFKEDYYTQPGDLYRLQSPEEQERLVATFVGGLSAVDKEDIKLRQISHLYKADAEFGKRVAEGLGLSVPDLTETK
jgi:catalase